MDNSNDRGKVPASVVDALERVREVGVPGLVDEDMQIAELVRRFQDADPVRYGGRRTREVVRDLLTAAVDSIQDDYPGSLGRALLIEFGALTVDGRSWRTSGKREDAAAGIAGAKYNTYRKKELRQRRIADVAAAVADLLAAPAPEQVVELDPADPFVRRPGLERRFTELIRDRTPMIAFAGPPSAGKRTLVEHLTRTHRSPAASVVRLDGTRPDLLQHTMISELERLGMHGIHYGAPQYSLRDLLRSTAPPRYVVIEDADDTELASFLAAVNSGTTIVLTTTHRFPGIPTVAVGDLEPAEAAQLLARVLPGSTPAEVNLLAKDLGRHVLALLIAADMITTEQTTVREFVTGLGPSVTDLLDVVGGRPALTSLYRKVLDKLTPDARAALELLVYLGSADVPTALMVFALPHYRGQPDTSRVHARVRTRAALQELRNRHLITVTDGLLSVPNLVRSLVIGLTHDDGHRIAAHARTGVLALVAELRAERPDMPLLRFAQAYAPLISHVNTTLLDPWKTSDHIGEHVRYYAQAFKLFMEAIDAEPWRFVLLALPTGDSSYSLIMNHVAGPVDADTALEIDFPVPDHKRIRIHMPGWGARRRMVVQVIMNESAEDEPALIEE